MLGERSNDDHPFCSSAVTGWLRSCMCVGRCESFHCDVRGRTPVASLLNDVECCPRPAYFPARSPLSLSLFLCSLYPSFFISQCSLSVIPFVVRFFKFALREKKGFERGLADAHISRLRVLVTALQHIGSIHAVNPVKSRTLSALSRTSTTLPFHYRLSLYI